jgi:hypothetical protein
MPHRPVLAIGAIAALALPPLATVVVPADRAAPSPPPFIEPNLAAARDALLVAQEQLGLAGSGKAEVYGGHRKLALQLVNTALEQVDAGLRVAAEEAAQREQEAAAKKPPPRRRRRR